MEPWINKKAWNALKMINTQMNVFVSPLNSFKKLLTAQNKNKIDVIKFIKYEEDIW